MTDKGNELRIEYVPLGELARWPRNPKGHDQPAIERSIKRFGYVDPILIDEGTGKIVGGHGRLDALLAKKAAGEPLPKNIQNGDDDWRVPVVRGQQFDSEEEAAAYLLADNQLTIAGGWEDELPSFMQDLDDAGVDLTGLGFSDSDLDEYLGRGGSGEGNTDADEVPDPPKTPVTKTGDVWQLGRHRLVCGDSTKSDSWNRILTGEQIDLVWTDPPYGVSYKGGSHVEGTNKERRPIANDEMTGDQLREFLASAFDQCIKKCKPGASWYVAAPPGTPFLEFGSALLERGIWRHTLAWVKDSLVMGRADYHYRFESVFYGWLPNGTHRWFGGRDKSNVLEFPRPKKSELHPTMKPVELVEFCIQNSSQSGDFVMDPFSGSGTTIMASERTDRRGYGIEFDPIYCDVIIERWENFTGGKAERVSNG